jgi:hypothetical protein
MRAAQTIYEGRWGSRSARNTSARNALSSDTNIRGIDSHPPLIATDVNWTARFGDLMR